MSLWMLLLAALGVAVFLEGLPCFVSPKALRQAMAIVMTLSDPALRALGFAMMVVGLGLYYLAMR